MQNADVSQSQSSDKKTFRTISDIIEQHHYPVSIIFSISHILKVMLIVD